jgi:hypothetical protein
MVGADAGHTEPSEPDPLIRVVHGPGDDLHSSLTKGIDQAGVDRVGMRPECACVRRAHGREGIDEA